MGVWGSGKAIREQEKVRDSRIVTSSDNLLQLVGRHEGKWERSCSCKNTGRPLKLVRPGRLSASDVNVLLPSTPGPFDLCI